MVNQTQIYPWRRIWIN